MQAAVTGAVSTFGRARMLLPRVGRSRSRDPAPADPEAVFADVSVPASDILHSGWQQQPEGHDTKPPDGSGAHPPPTARQHRRAVTTNPSPQLGIMAPVA